MGVLQLADPVATQVTGPLNVTPRGNVSETVAPVTFDGP